MELLENTSLIRMCSRMIAPISYDHNVLVRPVSREDVERDYQTAGGQPKNKIMH